MTHGRLTNPALVKPIDTAVLPPRTDPLDEGVLLQSSNQNSLATDDLQEDATTPEASLSHTELEDMNEAALDGSDANIEESPSQSTLSGGTFHTTHLESSDYADSDESQSWQIKQAERGTGSIEH